MATTFASVDEYLESFPDPVGQRLESIRRIALDVVPGAGERISGDRAREPQS